MFCHSDCTRGSTAVGTTGQTQCQLPFSVFIFLPSSFRVFRHPQTSLTQRRKRKKRYSFCQTAQSGPREADNRQRSEVQDKESHHSIKLTGRGGSSSSTDSCLYCWLWPYSMNHTNTGQIGQYSSLNFNSCNIVELLS